MTSCLVTDGALDAVAVPISARKGEERLEPMAFHGRGIMLTPGSGGLLSNDIYHI